MVGTLGNREDLADDVRDEFHGDFSLKVLLLFRREWVCYFPEEPRHGVVPEEECLTSGAACVAILEASKRGYLAEVFVVVLLISL